VTRKFQSTDVVDENVRARAIALMRMHHRDLITAGVRLDLVFVSEEDEDGEITPALNHHGAPAYATVRKRSPKDKALGAGDAEIAIDLASWLRLTPEQRDAVLDHELTHLVAVPDAVGDDGRMTIAKTGPDGRPKLRMRHHDFQFGWFSEVAQRHGAASIEQVQAREILSDARGQIIFAFAEKTSLRPTADGVAVLAQARAAQGGPKPKLVRDVGKKEDRT